MHLPRMRQALLRWYRKHHRALPWRAQPGQLANPYHVLVSEIMLQQTQVATVIDYFNRFVARWPTLYALANADESQVLRLWQGLGYYRRARMLHQAAQVVVRDHGGQLPADLQLLRKLPGVGPYTAGAIASIAFAIPASAVDGNVIRVITRLLAINQPVSDPKVLQQIRQTAEHWQPATHPGDFNQALMELGATVCSPKAPRCLLCPVKTHCQALQQHIVEELPILAPRQSPKQVTHHVITICHRQRWLFVQRPLKGLWSKLWQFPTCEQLPADLPDSQLAHQLTLWLRRQYGLHPRKLTLKSEFTHPTTHRLIRFVIWQARSRGQSSKLNITSAITHHWRTFDDLDDLPMSNPQRQVRTLLQPTRQIPLFNRRRLRPRLASSE